MHGSHLESPLHGCCLSLFAADADGYRFERASQWISSLRSQFDKAKLFSALHASPNGFVIPNPWDVGTARILELLGFRALATTSAGLSSSRGKPDSTVPREPLLAHLAEIAAATRLPVSADLENGFGEREIRR
jgi:2-methylisocitrate lyase-like PEP mutase family enzyme